MRVLVAQQVHDLLASLKGDNLWRLLKGFRHRQSRAGFCLWLAGRLACTQSFCSKPCPELTLRLQGLSWATLSGLNNPEGEGTVYGSDMNHLRRAAQCLVPGLSMTLRWADMEAGT